ncbi:hypothetical protein CLOP_g20647 [Closterium sp. NIES-67]|nr:hypothetical protein CLOP_g19565 [Closterium sp. NIES-67]GJP63576.1 hypothetical protein CLOP_g20647 [Closterium sp. NIES-67]
MSQSDMSQPDVPQQHDDRSRRAEFLRALGADDLEGGQDKNAGMWAEARSKFEWLLPVNIRDGKGRRPGEPGYDSRSVTVPRAIFDKLSASQKQYWSTKSRYMDTILFFKVGKFYELYEVDAEVGHKELDWKLTVSGVGKCRQVGVPESGIEDAVQKLVARGYKVGRMEQLETSEEAKAKRGPGAMVQRQLTQILSPATLTEGSLRPEAVHLLAIKETLAEADGVNSSSPNGSSSSITPSSTPSGSTESILVGFAFADVAGGSIYVGAMRDDSSRSALSALLIQVAPQELLFELDGLSSDTRKLLRRSSGPGILPMQLTALAPGSEFPEPKAALARLKTSSFGTTQEASQRWQQQQGQVFSGSGGCGGEGRGTGSLVQLLVGGGEEEAEVAAAALVALGSHLERLKWSPAVLASLSLRPYSVFSFLSLRLDGQTLSNLELLSNTHNGSTQGTLLGFLDTCATSGGKRLLRRWICHPLRSIREIERRLDAVDELAGSSLATSALSSATSAAHARGEIRAAMRRLPDLERLIGRMRAMGAQANGRGGGGVGGEEEDWGKGGRGGGDGRGGGGGGGGEVEWSGLRAALEALPGPMGEKLLRKQVFHLCAAVRGVKAALRFLDSFKNGSLTGEPVSFRSAILRGFMRLAPAASANRDWDSPDFALSEGDSRGASPEEELEECEGRGGGGFGIGAEQLSGRRVLSVLDEMEQCILWPAETQGKPAGRGKGSGGGSRGGAATSGSPRLVSDDSSITSLRSGKGASTEYARNNSSSSSSSSSGLGEAVTAEARLLAALLAQFSSLLPFCSLLSDSLAQLDVLLAFADASQGAAGAGPMCRPTFVAAAGAGGGGGGGGGSGCDGARSASGGGGSTFHARGLWHPFAVGGGGVVVPNDVLLGGMAARAVGGGCAGAGASGASAAAGAAGAAGADGGGSSSVSVFPRTVLLTGPNMGGKSTLLRATCVAAIMAQMGCFVPCSSLVLSPADVIFTRLGASDRIISGESTFMVECRETAAVMRCATRDSLVILDELGRGTSTFDGYAIAHAVLDYLTSRLDCRLLFATHYHPLTSEFAGHPQVALRHMACQVQARKSGEGEEDEELVFLYKLHSGACPKSYGLKVASMAGIPSRVVMKATQAASALEHELSDKFDNPEPLAASKLLDLERSWVQTLQGVAACGASGAKVPDEDAEDTFETLYCIWHEVRHSQ